MDKAIFKAYDIRGIYPDEIDEAGVRAIGVAYAEWLKPKTVVVGRDVRLSSPALAESLIKGLTDQGVNVTDIGVISTDMLYHAVATTGADGGLTVTASHNPREYNGLKLVKKDAVPISADSGLLDIAELAMAGEAPTAKMAGQVKELNLLKQYLQHVKSFADLSALQSMKVVVNGNFGLAGQVIKELLAGTPVELIPLNEHPDGSFPKGRPDPLLPENRHETVELIIKSGADLGLAWDADADRCFFYDENGEFVDGYFMTAILAAIMLERSPGAKIIHDPRLTWAVIDTVKRSGGQPIMNKAGHTFIKERLRREDAVFAGEMSAHYYFCDNFYCDNGMIPAVIMLEYLTKTQQRLSELARPYRETYFISGEINSEVDNADEIIIRLEQDYSDGHQDHTDGLSVEYDDWRFNVRTSNTEPLIRLNVEARRETLMENKKDELLSSIRL